MKKLFENVGGNQFKLITEGVITEVETNPKTELIRKGLKKVFASGVERLPYKQIENIGLGYIHDVNEARKCAIQEAKELAREYGYVENQNKQAFLKEYDANPVSQGDDETREVQIGRELIKLSAAVQSAERMDISQISHRLAELGTELLKMHGQ